jgi:hypothetical protein
MSSTINTQHLICKTEALFPSQSRFWVWMLALGVLLAVGFREQPAFAGRYVLNQSPATIERSFGRYWTKLTQTDEKGGKSVIYTYSPAPLQRYFPDRPFATLSMTYRNDRVRSVTMKPYRTAEEQQKDYIKLTDKTVMDQAMEAKLFEAIFGYRPPIYKPLYLNYGSFYSYINCLGDGVASSYSIHLGERLDGGITLTYNPVCEPPYNRIRYKEEKGPSGG